MGQPFQHGRVQQVGLDRLGNEVIEAGEAAFLAGLVADIGRQGDDGDVLLAGQLPDLAGRLDPAAPGAGLALFVNAVKSVS